MNCGNAMYPSAGYGEHALQKEGEMDTSLKRYSKGEEVFNSVTHGIGALLAVIGTVIMVMLSAINGTALGLAVSLIYGISLIVLYTMSTVYHAIPFPKVKTVLRVFDHTSIFLLIAGTYTPYCLIALQGNRAGLWVAVAVWACAIVGIILNAIDLKKTEKLGIVLYVIMGWAVIVVIKDVVAAISTQGFWLLLLGGISYTGGIVFYAMKKKKFMHSVWHLFVLMGSVLHYLSIVLYVLPMSY